MRGSFSSRDQLGHVALDLVGDAETAVGDGSFVAHGMWESRPCETTNPAFFAEGGVWWSDDSRRYRVRATSLTSKNSSWSPSAMSL